MVKFEDNQDEMIVVKGEPESSKSDPTTSQRLTFELMKESKHTINTTLPPPPPSTTTTSQKNTNILLEGILSKPGKRVQSFLGLNMWKPRKVRLTKGLQMYSSHVDDKEGSSTKHVLDLSVGTVRIKWIKSKLTFEIRSTVPCDTSKLFRAETVEEWGKWKKCLTKNLKRKKKKKKNVAPPVPPAVDGDKKSTSSRTKDVSSSEAQRAHSPLYVDGHSSSSYDDQSASTSSHTAAPDNEHYPWQMCEDENGYIYWYNVESGESVWDGDWDDTTR
jgi:hypothetical protein